MAKRARLETSSILRFIFAICALSFLASCSFGQHAIDETSQKEADDAAVSDAAEPLEEQEDDVVSLSVNEAYKTDLFELSPQSVEWVDGRIDRSDGSAAFPEQEEYTYLVAKFSFYNKSDVRCKFGSVSESASIFIDDGENDRMLHADTYDPMAETKVYASHTPCEPNETREFWYIASVSNDVRENVKSAELHLTMYGYEATTYDRYLHGDDAFSLDGTRARLVISLF